MIMLESKQQNTKHEPQSVMYAVYNARHLNDKIGPCALF